ncbi:MAG: hypothetical protein MJ208_01690 [Bacilli bacterium]|nr:hypothetical protein [Bacilli bacterium]
MEQIPDIFRRGKVAYDELCLKLFNLYKILPLKARKELFLDKSKKINDDIESMGFKNMRKDFNELIQYALLDAGTSTDKVSYLEMLYVADIGDLEVRLDHYLADTLKKSDKRFKCTYLMLPDQLPDDILYFKKCIFEYIEPIRVRILKSFQIVSTLNKKMKVQEYLLTDFAELYEAFLSVDKRMEKEDPMIAVNKMKEFFFEHIKDYKSKVKSLLK